MSIQKELIFSSEYNNPAFTLNATPDFTMKNYISDSIDAICCSIEARVSEYF